MRTNTMYVLRFPQKSKFVPYRLGGYNPAQVKYFSRSINYFRYGAMAYIMIRNFTYAILVYTRPYIIIIETQKQRSNDFSSDF